MFLAINEGEGIYAQIPRVLRGGIMCVKFLFCPRQEVLICGGTWRVHITSLAFSADSSTTILAAMERPRPGSFWASPSFTGFGSGGSIEEERMLYDW